MDKRFETGNNFRVISRYLTKYKIVFRSLMDIGQTAINSYQYRTIKL